MGGEAGANASGQHLRGTPAQFFFFGANLVFFLGWFQEKVKIGIYCYVIADILTNALHKCSLSSLLCYI